MSDLHLSSPQTVSQPPSPSYFALRPRRRLSQHAQTFLPSDVPDLFLRDRVLSRPMPREICTIHLSLFRNRTCSPPNARQYVECSPQTDAGNSFPFPSRPPVSPLSSSSFRKYGRPQRRQALTQATPGPFASVCALTVDQFVLASSPLLPPRPPLVRVDLSSDPRCTTSSPAFLPPLRPSLPSAFSLPPLSTPNVSRAAPPPPPLASPPSSSATNPPTPRAAPPPSCTVSAS